MKKVKKKTLALHSNNLALHYVFGGQIASNLRPYGRNAQIICIGGEQASYGGKATPHDGERAGLFAKSSFMCWRLVANENMFENIESLMNDAPGC